MSAIYILIFASLGVALLFLIAFFWAVNKGQFDDDYTPSVRILFDNGKPEKETKEKTNKTEKNEQD